MTQPWENDDCADVQAYYTHYPIPVAAALWCGIPPAQVDAILKQCSQVGRAIYSHPNVPCIEPRCRAINEAIDNGVLEARREGNKVAAGEHVAPERRTVSRDALKEWIANAFPASKPAFLFDDIERSAHAAINADSFRALQADRDAYKTRVEKATDVYKKLKQERDELESERNELRAKLEKHSSPGERAESTYLNIIGGLLGLLLGKTSSGKLQSVFDSQTSVIDALVARHTGKSGIAERTLQEKFAAAKRSLES